MQIATRMRQVRLERSLSLEELSRRTGLSVSLLDRFENGQDIPSLEMFDDLARAEGVPVESLFYGDPDSKLTPWLSERLSLQQLAEGWRHTMPTLKALLPASRRLRAATKGLLSHVKRSGRGRIDKSPHFPVPPPERQGRASKAPGEDKQDVERHP
jgi:transcriptional regulator with XRE-family HTH domain